MEDIQHYETKDKEKENLHKSFYTPLEKSIYKIKVDGEIPFNFYYTSLTEEFKKDFDKILNKNFTKPNSFLYAKESFSIALEHLLTMFSSPKDLPCFSGNYSINVFLAEDFDELCSIGSKEKLNLPSFAQGRVTGTTLVYVQRLFLNDSKKYEKEIPEHAILGEAHELLHIFFHYNSIDKYGRLYKLPLLFSEGLTVICANQITKNFKEDFISAEHLFLEKVNVFEHDKRWITENRYYQSAGQFMDYLLKVISKKEEIEYKEAFQKVFSTIGCPESFNEKKKFDSTKYFKEIFDLNILKEYNSFLKDLKN
ncbi:MAG TPA: hypothetical protein VJ438_01800 [Candidatus Nanoarchaeia archaeon]|nr:hypothetical protein [Candidatus Nanoarchaeia archaeon]